MINFSVKELEVLENALEGWVLYMCYAVHKNSTSSGIERFKKNLCFRKTVLKKLEELIKEKKKNENEPLCD